MTQPAKPYSREKVIRQEFQDALEDAQETVELVEPTEEEARNGWTAETLTAYLQEQTAAQSLRIDPNSAFRKRAPIRANSKYRPLRWRG